MIENFWFMIWDWHCCGISGLAFAVFFFFFLRDFTALGMSGAVAWSRGFG